MSFDLYVFDDPGIPDRPDGLDDLLEDDKRWGEPLSSSLQHFVDELASEFPGLDEDPAGSPWSSWPLEGNSIAGGRGCGFNIGWSHADQMLNEFERRCRQSGLTLYDPQSDRVHRPSSPGRWWQIWTR